MKYFILISLLIIGVQSSHSQNTSYNIIYILADDLGYGDLGCYGQEFIETPNIDLLAKQGIKFTRHYSGSPVCAPSRASLLTGLNTGHSPIRGNREIIPQGQYPLPDSTTTIAEVLQENGYQTAVIGKWGLGYPFSSGTPSAQGFGHFYGYNCQRKAHHYYPRKLWNDEEVVKVARKEYSHHLFTDEALEFIDDQSDNPFFLFLAYTIPHAKIAIPKIHTHHYEEKIQEDRSLSQLNKRDRRKVVDYASMVSLMDRDVGNIIAKLDSLDLLESTIIFFSSDNGPHSEDGYEPQHLNSSGDLRGQKRDLYEGGIRVPLVVSWKGHIAPNSTTDHLSAFWDFYPTINDLLSIPEFEYTDGISFLPTLLNTSNQKPHEYLYWEFHGRGGKQAVIAGDWKLLRLKINSPKPILELYNLADDPFELLNIEDAANEVSHELQIHMNNAHVKNPVFTFQTE